MANPVVEILGKDFEFIRIDKITSKNPIIFIEEGKLEKCKLAIKKLGITSVYTSTDTIEYLSDSVFEDTLVLFVHLSTLDYSPIQHLKKLKQLTLTSSAYDFDPDKVPELDLGYLDKLTILDCAIPNPIVNLDKLKKLTKVSISNDKGTSLSHFSTVSNLRELKLNGVVDESLGGVENLLKLTKLTIGGTHKLTSIKEIVHLENLKTLELRGNTLSDLSGIESLNNLEKLELMHFEKIDTSNVLRGLSNLKDFSMHNIASIDSLEFIVSLHNLKKIFVQPWSIHPKDGSFLPLTQKLVQMNALKQVIEWEDVYPHLDQAGQQIFKEHFKGTALDYIQRTYSFYQGSYNNLDANGPHTQKNCTRLDAVIHELIAGLGKYKKMSQDEKIVAFKTCLILMDELDFELKGFFETGEREHLHQILAEIGKVVAVNVDDFQHMTTPAAPKGFILEEYFNVDA